MSDTTRCRRGFTMLELIIVIAILAALAAVVVPMIGQTRDLAELSATKATLGALRDSLMGTPNKPGYLVDIRWLNTAAGNRPAISVGDLLDTPYVSRNPDGTIVSGGPVPADLVAHQQFAKFDPTTKLGWRGPYVQSNGRGQVPYPLMASTGVDVVDGRVGVLPVLDSWSGNPGNHAIILQNPTDVTGKDSFLRLVAPGRNGVIDTNPATTALTSAMIGDDVVLHLKTGEFLAQSVE